MLVKHRSFSDVRSKIIAMVEKGEYPSMAIAVAQGGKILWEEAFGWMNKDSKTKATPITIYPIASLSKSLTATGMMVLVEQKKVGLDDPVGEYIAPSRLTVYEGKASEVTVRRVLNMTSGIPHGYMVYKDPYSSLNLRKFIEQYGVVVFRPGDVELYSNFSYAVLELIIENITNASFADFMKTEVFDPLGMTQTSVGIPNSLKHAATKYQSNKVTIPHNYFVPAAAGGIYSSVHDLIRYAMFHLTNQLPYQRQILRDKTLTTMHTAKDGNLESAIMALGWGFVTLGDNTAWILSNGGIEGATSMLSLVPSADLAVVCLTNVTSRSRITDQIAIEITDAFLPKFSDEVEIFMKHYESKNALKSYRPTPQLIGSWEGEIKAEAAETPIKITFHDNGRVDVRLGKHQETALTNAGFGNGQLKGDFRGASLSEDRVQNESTHTISIHVKVEKSKMYGVATEEFEENMGLLSPSYVCLHRI